MPAITSVLVAVGGLGMSIHQMIKQNKLRKEAVEGGIAATNQAKGVTIQNELAGLQADTEAIELTKERQAQRDATLIPTIQQDARSAMGGAINIAEEGRQEDLDLTADTAKRMYDRDVKVLGEDQTIETARGKREYDTAILEAEGYGKMEADAQANYNVAAGSAMALGGDLASGIKEKWA